MCTPEGGWAKKQGERQQVFGSSGSLHMNPIASLAQETLSLSPVRAAALGGRPAQPGWRGLVFSFICQKRAPCSNFHQAMLCAQGSIMKNDTPVLILLCW